MSDSSAAPHGALPGPLAWTLARRLLADPQSRLLHASARAALLATTLGVAALAVALALMTGYREDLTAKLVGGNAAVLVYPGAAGREAAAEGGAEAAPAADRDAELAATLAAVPEVTRVDRVRYLEGVLSAANGEAEVTLRAAPDGAGLLAGRPGELARRPDGAWGARLGDQLAAALGVVPGDPLRLAVLAFGDDRPRFAFRTLVVASTFASGFSEFDRAWVVVAPAAIEGLPGGGAALWEVAVAEPGSAPAVAERIRAQLDPDALVTDWRQINRQLFSALDLQRRALFLLLGLIVLVATFNVASTLVVLVRERRRDLGVLSSLGLARSALVRVFLLYGGALGLAGTAIGLAVAAVASWTITRFELLSFGPEIAEVYFLRSVPLRLAASDALAVAGFTLAVTLLACWLPARRAARVVPATALRYE